MPPGFDLENSYTAPLWCVFWLIDGVMFLQRFWFVVGFCIYMLCDIPCCVLRVFVCDICLCLAAGLACVYVTPTDVHDLSPPPPSQSPSSHLSLQMLPSHFYIVGSIKGKNGWAGLMTGNKTSGRIFIQH